MTTTIKEDSHANTMKKMLAARMDLKNYVMENAQQGDLQNIIDTIDKFGWTKQWLMNIGDRKGQILDQAVQTRKPKSVLELGTISFIVHCQDPIFCFSFRYFSRLQFVKNRYSATQRWAFHYNRSRSSIRENCSINA
jgi:hypothetical protein